MSHLVLSLTFIFLWPSSSLSPAQVHGCRLLRSGWSGGAGVQRHLPPPDQEAAEDESEGLLCQGVWRVQLGAVSLCPAKLCGELRRVLSRLLLSASEGQVGRLVCAYALSHSQAACDLGTRLTWTHIGCLECLTCLVLNVLRVCLCVCVCACVCVCVCVCACLCACVCVTSHIEKLNQYL